jgi:hypothetical protein
MQFKISTINIRTHGSIYELLCKTKGSRKLFRNSLKTISLAFLLSGCVSSQVVVEKLNNKYVGKNFDEFVINYGSPLQKFILSSGDIVYTWSSASSTTISGGKINLFCEAQFITSPNGIIKEVTILKDTIGNWTTSMCHEFFYK